MKFNEMQYARPDLAAAAREMEQLAAAAKEAGSDEGLLGAYASFSALGDEVNTAGVIASVRHTIDTRDAFYDAENDYFDENGPVLADKALGFYRAALASPHKSALEKAYGSILLDKMELAVKSSDERLIPLQQRENALTTEYDKLYASAKIPFRGKTLTVAQLGPYKEDVDRATRKEAFEAEGGFFDQNRERLDALYGELVQNRAEQAKLLGYGSFAALGDIRMERLGYTRADIRACREEVAKGVVPVAAKVKAKQAKRIGVPDFKMYDGPLAFPDGNPTPKGTPEEILAAGQEMYHGLSAETAGFIDFMVEGGLFDVLAKPGKAPGGYCTYIPGYRSPFIFSNFNGTSGDVDVLTHEAGHAFAAYRAAERDYAPELRSPGLESCEIHSMGMEFLTAGYHKLFFGPDTEKYELAHAEDSLCFLPYGCAVDEFQEEVYARPSLSPGERNALWAELEKKYRPWVDFGGLPFYGRGAGWQRQLHIYTAPFYYIDYVLAQSVALQFFTASLQDKAGAWARYLALVEKGGTESYGGLVKAAGFQTPFAPGVMSRVAGEVYAWMETRPLFGAG